jgi:hypothetical protein
MLREFFGGAAKAGHGNSTVAKWYDPGHASTVLDHAPAPAPSLRANGSRECAPDDRLREAIQEPGKKDWIASSHPPSPEGGLRRTRELLAMTGLAMPNHPEIIILQPEPSDP